MVDDHEYDSGYTNPWYGCPCRWCGLPEWEHEVAE